MQVSRPGACSNMNIASCTHVYISDSLDMFTYGPSSVDQMPNRTKEQIARLKEKNAELEALIAKWAHANDPESKWMLHLLREALEVGRLKLKKGERDS